MGQNERLQAEIHNGEKIRKRLSCLGQFGLGLGYTLVGPNVRMALVDLPDRLNFCLLCPQKDSCFQKLAKNFKCSVLLGKRVRSNIVMGHRQRIQDMVEHHGTTVL